MSYDVRARSAPIARRLRFSIQSGLDMQKSELIKIYELSIQEEHYFLDAHQARVRFYTSIVSVLMGATVAGAMRATQPHDFLFLSIGPLLAFLTAWIALDGTYRLYQRFLESVTVRAKIESELGLTKERAAEEGCEESWACEPIVPNRHIKSRNKYQTAEDFVDESSRTGYHFLTRRLFRMVQLLTAVMLVGLLVMAAL